MRSRLASIPALLLQAWRSHARAGARRPTQTCLRCRTGISSATPRALLRAVSEFRVPSLGPLIARGTDSSERYLESMSSDRRAAYDRVSDAAARSLWPGASARPRVSRTGRSLTASVARRRRSRPTSTTPLGRRRGRSTRGTSACAAAAARTPSRATARASEQLSEIQGVPRFKFHEGKVEEFKRLCAELMDIVRAKDSGTLEFEIYLSDDVPKRR